MTGEISTNFDGYAFSLVGRKHIKNSVVCQDAHMLHLHMGKWQFLAVADGVGSAKHSDIGAKLAISAVLRSCSEFIENSEDAGELKSALKNGFTEALSTIMTVAKNENNAIEQYDTTLTVCLYDGTTAIFGHVGDGGIIGVDTNGKYKLLTKVQKGDMWNEVCPLRAGEKTWVFHKSSREYAALVLLTDGLFDQAMPSLLHNENESIYINFVKRFFPYEVIEGRASDDESTLQICDSSSVKKSIQNYLLSDECNHLTDDLSAVAVWNKSAMLLDPGEDYFTEPDWASLRMELYYKMYPALRPKEESNATKESTGKSSKN